MDKHRIRYDGYGWAVDEYRPERDWLQDYARWVELIRFPRIDWARDYLKEQQNG